ncbi:MAG: hypothetical protein ACI4QP_04295 [Candidatus Enteromonas sp.]
MASYKILKQVDGLENVLNMARLEAKLCVRYHNEGDYSGKWASAKSINRVCWALEMLGIVDNGETLVNDLRGEAWKESQKCNS